MNVPYSVHEINPFCIQAMAEHRALRGSFASIKGLLNKAAESDADKRAALAEVAGKISQFQAALTDHFRREERGGCLEEAVIRSPALAPEADRLLAEHVELSDMVEQLRADAAGSISPAEAWHKLAADYAQFEVYWLRHEAAEDSLLQKAFNEDFGNS
ncbi:MAG: hemerythrin domain-containing protein [Planctomycetaceae bacterium]|nr:hemerythrin domain-containing protein [Planctomycetaceae bacterium]